jgi:hypothetical protein
MTSLANYNNEREHMTDFTWSYSSLKQYQNCPKQYQEIRVLKNYIVKYVRDNKPLPKNYQRFKKYVDRLTAIEGKKYVEHEMALKYDRTPCDFDDEDRWVRGIVDLLIIDGDYAFIIDYKTGSKKYPDPKQLRLMALMTFTHFPDVQKIKAGLLFIMHDAFVTEEYHRRDMDNSWKVFEQPLKRLETSYETNTWQPNPTPLCGWCSVDSCEFNTK